MTAPPHRIGVPWDAPILFSQNGRHPLPESLVFDTDEFAFARTLQPQTPVSEMAMKQGMKRLRERLLAIGPPVTVADVDAFITSRDPASQVLMGGPMDLLFLHTGPMTLGQRPWVMHIESTLPMFEPFFGHFRTATIDLAATPGWHCVRHLIRAPECRGIFTHLERSRDDLPRLFRDEALAQKVHYAPLGIDLSPLVWRRAAEAIERKNAKGDDEEFVLLFTNSWHQDPESFYKRGGAETLVAFVGLLERQRNCRLILRTVLPDRIPAEIRAQIRSHPRVELYDEVLTTDALFDLLYRADFFLLPSANLHTISYLRAMATGAVILTTDVTAADEFVTDDQNGIVLPGRRGVCYWHDEENGLLREDLEPLRETNQKLAAELAAVLEALFTNRERRNRLRDNARRAVETRHGLGPWRAGFHAMLRAALPPPRA